MAVIAQIQREYFDSLRSTRNLSSHAMETAIRRMECELEELNNRLALEQIPVVKVKTTSPSEIRSKKLLLLL